MKEEKKNCGRGMNFLEGLTLLFIALKLCNVIDWSWFLVLLPEIIWFILALSQVILEFIKKILEENE